MHKKETILKVIIKLISFAFLLLGSFYFGYKGQTTEMGLCILSASLALAFANIDKIQKFKGAGFEAEMKMVQSIIDKETEPELQNDSEIQLIKFNQDEVKVIECLDHPSYTWRYPKTIAAKTGLKKDITLEILNNLKRKDLVVDGDGSSGQIWSLTLYGRQLLAKHKK